jgi:hypothetical protein
LMQVCAAQGVAVAPCDTRVRPRRSIEACRHTVARPPRKARSATTA